MRFMKPAFLLMSFLCTFAFSQTDTSHYYLMSFFRNDFPGTGDMTGAFFATSTDGLTWTVLNNNNPVLQPVGIGEGRVRDPYLYFDPMTQIFHLVYTTGWNTANIGYSSIVPANGKSFTDQNNWSPQVPLWVGDSVAGTVCCWAPEIFYDDIQNKYMIYLSIDVGVNGKQSYYFLTSDFVNYTKGKSPEYGTPKFFDPGFTEIDGDMLKVGDKNYYYFFKDERDGYKRIYYVSGPTPQGPWSPAASPFLGTINGVMSGCEGPSSIKMGSEYRVYFDPYSTRQNYRMVRSTDLVTWKDAGGVVVATDAYDVSAGYFDYSHCNVLEIPHNIYIWITTGSLAVKQDLKLLSPVYSSGVRFNVPGVYDIMGKKIEAGLSMPGQNAAMLPAGFYFRVDKDKKAVKDLQIQK